MLVFGSESCGPCRRNAPSINTLRSRFFVVDYDDERNPNSFAKYGVTVMPTYIVLIDGKECGRTSDPLVLINALERVQ